jgi:hypothetical protein
MSTMSQPFGTHSRLHLETLEDRLVPSTMAGDYLDGTWRYDSNAGWAHISSLRANFLDVDDAGNVYALYFTGPSAGLWRWSAATASWGKLSDLLPEELQVNSGGVLYGDFGSIGTWRWSPTAGWAKLTAFSPTFLAVSDSDAFFGAFTNGSPGTWRWTPTAGWSLLSSSLAAVLRTDSAGDFVGYFMAGGKQSTWRWNPSSGWAHLDDAVLVQLEVSENGTIFEYRRDTGIWRAAPGATTFSRIQSSDSSKFGGFAPLPDGSLYVIQQVGTDLHYSGWYWTPSVGGLGLLRIISNVDSLTLPVIGKDGDLFFRDFDNGTGHWSLQEPYDLLSALNPRILGSQKWAAGPGA